MYLQQKATQMLIKGRHSTWPLGDTYQVQMSGIGLQMPWWRNWREGWIILGLGKQIRHLVIFYFNFLWWQFVNICEIFICIVVFIQ